MVLPDKAMELVAPQVILSSEPRAPKSRFAGWDEGNYSQAGYYLAEDVAVIDISGALIYKGNCWWDWKLSYLDIASQFRAALSDKSVSSILLDIDSPGGEVAGVFDLVDLIYSSRGIKPIIASANEDCFSAAYAIASAADKIYLSRTAQVGSIGVIAMHVDQSGYDSQLGVKYTPVYAGKHKIDFNPHGELSSGAESALQDHVNKLYSLFVNTVARNRNLASSTIRGTEADIYTGQLGVDTGLADDVRSFASTLAEMVTTKNKRSSFAMDLKQVQEGLAILSVDSGDAVREMLSKFGYVPQAAVIDSQKAQADMAAAIVTARGEGIQEALQLSSELSELCQASGCPEMASGLIKSGSTVESAKATILAAKAAQDSDKHIQSTVGAMGSGEINPLLANARKRAGIQ